MIYFAIVIPLILIVWMVVRETEKLRLRQEIGKAEEDVISHTGYEIRHINGSYVVVSTYSRGRNEYMLLDLNGGRIHIESHSIWGSSDASYYLPQYAHAFYFSSLKAAQDSLDAWINQTYSKPINEVVYRVDTATATAAFDKAHQSDLIAQLTDAVRNGDDEREIEILELLKVDYKR